MWGYVYLQGYHTYLKSQGRSDTLTTNETVKAPFSVNKSQISRIQFTRTDHLKVQSVKVLVPNKNVVCVLFTYPGASNDFSETHVK